MLNDMIVSSVENREGIVVQENAGNNKIKFRAPSLANAKRNRYNVPVEKSVSVAKETVSVSEKYEDAVFEMTTREYLQVQDGDKKALKLKNARKDNLASKEAVVHNADERVVPASVDEVATPEEESRESELDKKPDALENTLFDLGGVLENANSAVTDEASMEETNDPIEQEVEEASVESSTSIVNEVAVSDVVEKEKTEDEKEVSDEINLGENPDMEEIYNKVVDVRNQTMVAMKEADEISAKVENRRAELNSKLEESDHKLQEANATEQEANARAMESERRFQEKQAMFKKAVIEQSRLLAQKRENCVKLIEAKKAELINLENDAEAKLAADQDKIAEYVARAATQTKKADEFDSKTNRLNAIMEAIMETPSITGDFVPDNVVQIPSMSEENEAVKRIA